MKKTKKIETTMILFDNEKNRKKIACLNKIEVMADDSDNKDFKFWEDLEDFIEWGKTYKLTIEEMENKKELICAECGHYWHPSQHEPDTCSICGMGEAIVMGSKFDWRRRKRQKEKKI